MWHLRIQTILVSAGSIGLSFVLTAAGGVVSDTYPPLAWTIGHLDWPLFVFGYLGATLLFVFDLLRARSRPSEMWSPLQVIRYLACNSEWAWKTGEWQRVDWNAAGEMVRYAKP